MIDQTIDRFEWKRFTAIFTRYISEHGKTLLGGIGVTAGILILLALLMGRSYSEVPAELKEALSDNEFNSYERPVIATALGMEMMMFYGVFNIFVMIAGSLTFSSLKSKTRRINALMIPATKSEKYFTLIIIYTLLADVGFFIACVAADIVHSLASGLPTIWAGLSYLNVPEDATFWKAVTIMMLAPMFNQAVYTLGSSLWPKRSFLITFCAIFVTELLVMMFAPVIDTINFIDSLPFGVAVGGTMAIIVVLYVLAWARFNRIQLMQRFLSN